MIREYFESGLLDRETADAVRAAASVFGRLGAEVEEEVQRALRDENLGPVQVRFRVCRDESDGLKFICKVENPPRVDGDGTAPPWRWWSPLLETAEEFRDSLDEGLNIRRQRLAMVATRG